VKSLFDRVQIGDLELPNRIVMGPMTRARANDADEPMDIHATYYAQRASAGLIITEGVYPSVEGKGYFATPGIETEAQTAAWKRVTDAVHARGGRIFIQMMHCGRVGHPDNKPGIDHVAPSAVTADFPILTPDKGLQPMSAPRALDTAEVKAVIDRFERAAQNAKDAGFDGIELHAASGYLPNQFLASNTNLRTDEYGGSPEKRGRFVLEVMERFIKVFGPQRSAIKLAPGITYNDIHDETVDETYTHLLGHLDRMGLAYLHFQTVLNYTSLGQPVTLKGPEDIDALEKVYPYAFMRERFSGPLMAAGDLTHDLATAVLNKGAADLFVFGRAFISNPDLPERMRAGAPLALPSQAHFYGGGAEGLIDYPALADA
jgi:N-ethylmaleimide reductase